jgi:GTP-binding protein YchF
MGFKCGIVGLPNVGKSTLFNALTQTAAAEAANYPFCTIEPNVGDVGVARYAARQAGRDRQVGSRHPDAADLRRHRGLVRGASKGEGLGNQFLAVIREVDAVAYVLRCFENDDITHVEGRIDPVADAETVETELMLADLDSLERRRDPLEKKAKGGDKEAKAQLVFIDKALELLREGKPARLAKLSAEEQPGYRALQLLTAKPVLYVCNVDEASAAAAMPSPRRSRSGRGRRAPAASSSRPRSRRSSPASPRGAREFLQEMGSRKPASTG